MFLMPAVAIHRHFRKRIQKPRYFIRMHKLPCINISHTKCSIQNLSIYLSVWFQILWFHNLVATCFIRNEWTHALSSINMVPSDSNTRHQMQQMQISKIMIMIRAPKPTWRPCSRILKSLIILLIVFGLLFSLSQKKAIRMSWNVPPKR